MKKILLAITVIFSLSITGAQAQFLDGNRLYSLCSTPRNFTNQTELLGYVMSDADTLMVAGAACFPENAIAGQLKDVVCKGLKAEPEKRQLPAIVLSSMYLAKAFPCPAEAKQ